MSEQLPDSIPNNFQLQEQSSGLLTAESRVNHSYTELEQGPVKTRGMGYTETELGGKPFIIAERLQPGAQQGEAQHSPEPQVRQATADSSAESGGSEPEAGPSPEQDSFQNPVKVQYNPEGDGQVRLGLEFTTPGDVMDWTKNNYTTGTNRQIIIETINGGRFYVRGNTVYDLTLSQRTGKLRSRVFENPEDLNSATIGQPWIPGSQTLHELADPVKKVAIGERIAPQDWLGAGGPIDAEYQKRGRDPFAAADALIGSLRGNEQNVSRPTIPNRPPAPVDPPTAPTERLPRVEPQAQASEKFDHSQSFISWYKRNRSPEIKQMKRKEKRGAQLAAFVDYLTANVADTDFYGDYKRKIGFDDRYHEVESSLVGEVAARLKDIGGSAAERAARATSLVMNIGRTAASKTVDHVSDLAFSAMDLGYRTAELTKRKLDIARELGFMSLGHMIGTDEIVQIILNSPNEGENSAEEDDEA